jgi:hypothetical protein
MGGYTSTVLNLTVVDNMDQAMLACASKRLAQLSILTMLQLLLAPPLETVTAIAFTSTNLPMLLLIIMLSTSAGDI